MARLIEHRDSAEVTVTVRHRCPSFTFGSALGPHDLDSWWFRSADTGHISVMTPAGAPEAARQAIGSAISARLSGEPDYRRHLDELAELP